MRFKKIMVHTIIFTIVLTLGIFLGLDIAQFRSSLSTKEAVTPVDQSSIQQQGNSDLLKDYAADRKANREALLAELVPNANQLDDVDDGGLDEPSDLNSEKQDVYAEAKQNDAASNTKIDTVADKVGSLLQVTADKGVRQVVSWMDKLLD